MCKLKNYKDGRRLLWSRFKSGNVKQFINTIKYRFKYGFFYSELWNLGEDVSQYVLKRVPYFYDAGYVPTFVYDEDMFSHGFQMKGGSFTSTQYEQCWTMILFMIQYYLTINTVDNNVRIEALRDQTHYSNYQKGSRYFGRYLPHFGF